jgi:biotin operon repressor
MVHSHRPHITNLLSVPHADAMLRARIMQSSHEVIDKDIEQQRRWGVPLASRTQGKLLTGPVHPDL